MRLHKSAAFLMMALLVCLAFAAPAMAQQIKGGHDETSEALNSGWATLTPPTPGTPPAVSASHLLITEFATQGTPVEFFELYNPTSEPVDLGQYYVTDAWYEGVTPFQGYYLYPSGTFVITTNTDFCCRFPMGATIAPGGSVVVALYGAGVDSVFGAGTVDYEVTPSSLSIPDLISVGGNTGSSSIACGATTLTNAQEFLCLFFWDGVSDNVCDVDYVTFGTATTTNRVCKTGFSVDGPDLDVVATMYNNDTADASQTYVSAAVAGSSKQRSGTAEGVETLTGGNGCVPGGPTPIDNTTWGQIKALYR